jgi:hypothetical protein
MRIWRRSFPRSWLRCSNIQEFNRAVIAYTAAAGGGDDAMPGCCWHDRTGTAMRQQAPGPRRLFLAPYRTLARAGSVSRRRRSRLSARMRQRRADCRHATHDACLHEPACRMASLLGSERWRLSGRRRNRRIMLPFATPSRSIEGSNLPPRTSLPARIAHGVRLALARLRPRPHEKTRRRDLPGRHGSRWTEEGGTTAPPCSPAWTTP